MLIYGIQILEVREKGLTWFLNQFNFVGNEAEAQFQKEIFEVWLLSILFKSILHTKPILTFLGPQGSGKTTCNKLIGRLFLGNNFNVSGLRTDKEDAFVASITNRIFYSIDNADSRVTWLEDALARYATGETFRLRRLYSTNEEVSYKPRAILMLTSRDPHFRRPDVAERLLIMRLNRLEKFKDEDSLFNDLSNNRSIIMGDLLNKAGEALESLKVVPAPQLGFRMADFASFGWRIYKSKGIEKRWEEIMDWLVKQQSAFASEGDSLIEIIKMIVGTGIETPVTTGDLFTQGKTIAEEQNLPFPKTPQSFGRRFWEMQRVIELELDVKIKQTSIGGGKKAVVFQKVE